MSTKAQIEANRRNARNSTGPRTTKGKDVVSQNALKHGIFASRDVIDAEDQAEFALFRQQLIDQWDPSNPMELLLTERLIALSWRLKRALRIQNQTIDALNTKDKDSAIEKLKHAHGLIDSDDLHPEFKLGYMAISDFSNNRVLERLLMYERRLENSMFKTITELQRLNIAKHVDLQKEIQKLTEQN
jgi:hypothetical protein